MRSQSDAVCPFCRRQSAPCKIDTRANYLRLPPPRSTKFDSNGQLYLSTLRMVFVAEGRPGASFSAFDLPLATTSDEKFNQPIFGANNMTGTNPPLDGTGLTADIKWCISFRNGGVGTFLPFFFGLLGEMRTRMSRPQAAAEAIPASVAQSMVQQAFVDPSDPTKFYVPA